MKRITLDTPDAAGLENKEPLTSDPLHRAMKEKYLHSMGALLNEEARFDEARGHLCAALALDDTPHTRFDLALAYEGKGEFDRALHELDRAIELAPRVPEYFYKRSHLFRTLGEPDKAAEDLARAWAIDPDYRRIEDIRSALHTVESALGALPVESGYASGEAIDPILRAALTERTESARLIHETLEHSTCPVRACPAYCCHFTGPTVRHGLAVGAWKLRAIQEQLRNQGFEEEDFLDRMPFHGEEYVRSLVPPYYFLNTRDGRFVFFPKRGDAFLDPALSPHIPRGRDFRTLMWVNDRARPCRFLRDRRCMIHDAGGEEGLDTCKQFLCFTGFVALALICLGILEEGRIHEVPIDRINTIAVDGLLILFRTLYEDGQAEVLRSRMDRAMESAVHAEKTGDGDTLAGELAGYGAVRSQYEGLMRERTKRAKGEIDRLLARVTRGGLRGD